MYHLWEMSDISTEFRWIIVELLYLLHVLSIMSAVAAAAPPPPPPPLLRDNLTHLLPAKI